MCIRDSFYINGRYVRNRTMMAGMEMAFKGTMMQGKFPGGILLLEMPTDLVDVNVHPAKIEARFARENDVFDVVYHAVKLALAKAAVAPAEETAPEQTASEEVVEEAAPSEAAEPEETPVTAPTVEVVQPEEKRTVPAWLKEVWQQLFPAETPDGSEPASSEEVLPASEAALPTEETETEPETEGAAE